MKRLFLLLALVGICTATPAAARERGQAVIFETDMGNDIDDAMALDLLLKKHEQGVINLLGVSVHKNNPCAAEFIDIMRRWYGHADIPIGVSCVTVAECDDYTTRVCRMKDGSGKPLFARSRRPNYEEAVAMYRRLLSKQEDGSVVIVSVGFSTTVAALLKSGPDRYSPLTGRELVARKVKFFSVMGGEFEMKNYSEYNIVNDIPAAQYFFDNTPVPVVITPFKLGTRVQYPGRSIEEDFGWTEAHPMVEAYKAYAPMPYDRPTWDVIACLYLFDHTEGCFTLGQKGEVRVTDKGVTEFMPKADGRFRVIEATDGECGRILDYFLRELPTPPRKYAR